MSERYLREAAFISEGFCPWSKDRLHIADLENRPVGYCLKCDLFMWIDQYKTIHYYTKGPMHPDIEERKADEVPTLWQGTAESVV